MGLGDIVGVCMEKAGFTAVIACGINELVGYAHYFNNNPEAFERCLNVNGMIMLAAVPIYVVGAALGVRDEREI